MKEYSPSADELAFPDSYGPEEEDEMSITDATPEQVRQIMGDGKAEEQAMEATQARLDRAAQDRKDLEDAKARIWELTNGLIKIKKLYADPPFHGLHKAIDELLKEK